MTYNVALKELDKSGVVIGNPLTTTSCGEGFGFISYELIYIVISPISELKDVKFEMLKRLSNEDALKSLKLIDNDNLEVILTFWNDQIPPKAMTLTEYLDHLKYLKP